MTEQTERECILSIHDGIHHNMAWHDGQENLKPTGMSKTVQHFRLEDGDEHRGHPERNWEMPKERMHGNAQAWKRQRKWKSECTLHRTREARRSQPPRNP